ncbi:MAG TPA: LysM domain-containing protein [Anaerolineae bacterium]|nr:LysM domain-containing protein [Anaerolineae bacterium]
MAKAIGAAHLLIKVGHGPHYFPETTRTMLKRVRTLGLHPLAWIQITNRVPQDAFKAILEALAQGYETVVLSLNNTPLAAESMQRLVELLDNAEAPRQRLCLSTPPFIQLPTPDAAAVIALFCQGGWMPQCSAMWGENPDQVIDRDVYQTLSDLSLMWGKTPEVYPVLSPVNKDSESVLLPETFIPWVESITRHGIDFFSIYHAANTEKTLWSMLEAVNVACLETDEHTSVAEPGVVESVALVQPIYITVSASDTVWGIISRHGLTKQQFWTWNAHLWESRGLPRDPDYLQEGWRIRIK